jgi:uncharacterized protein (TIGR02271 family)
MTHTLVAAFDSLTDAETAKAKLIGLNIAQGNIQLSSSGSATAGATTTAGAAASQGSAAHHDESFGEKVSHFFSSLFGEGDDGKPHHYASAYPEAYRRGATLLTVTVATDEEAERVEDLLEDSGAIDIDERSATWTDGGAGASGVTHVAGAHQGADLTPSPAVGATTGTTGATTGTATGLVGEAAIPVIEEQLRVGKREVNTGRVRVVTRVTERPVEETVSLHEEQAVIERNPVNREATGADLAAFKDGTIEIQETAEEVVVGKTARVVEEVRVGTKATDRSETVRDTVRRTDVDVEGKQGVRTSAAASSERDTPITPDRKI